MRQVTAFFRQFKKFSGHALVLVAIFVLSACNGGAGSTDGQNGSPPGNNTTPTAGDTTRPSVSIASPTSAATYSTTNANLNIGGSASDNVSVTQVTWSNSLGGSGTAIGTTSWSVNGITLQNGSNVITVTARDAANNTATDTLTVTYSATSGGTPPPPPSTPPTAAQGIKLVPATTGTNMLVSFGIPFPPDMLLDASRVRVLDENGAEIAAYVAPKVYWHFKPNNSAIRSVLVQLRMDFPTMTERNLSFNISASRQLSLPAQNYVDGLISGKTTGTEIPAVFAVLSPEWMVGSLVAGPQVTKAANAGFTDYEQWFESFYAQAQNYAYGTATNWLFDRTTAIYKQYIRTGNVNYLREAYNSASYYRTHISTGGSCPGSFDLRSCDWKYAYNEPLALHYLLTGDERYKNAAILVADGWDGGFNPDYTVGNGFWTERHAGFGWLAALHAWEITGTQTHKDRVTRYANTLINHVTNPPDNRGADGCWRHDSFDHDAAEFSSNYAGCSAWMSVIILDALWQYWTMTEDTRVGAVARNFVSFLEVYGWVATDRTYYFPSSQVAASSYANSEDQWTDLHNLELIFAYALAYGFDNDTTRRQAYMNKINQIRGIFNSGPSGTFRAFNWAFRGTSPFLYLLQQ